MRHLLKNLIFPLCIPFFLVCACRTVPQPPTPTPTQQNTIFYPDSTSLQKIEQDISQPQTKKRKLIALTFDDAPLKTLENILAVFASYNEQNPDCPATATVFFNGKNLTSTQLPLLQTAYAMGFELGNHTATHANLNTLTPMQIKKEIDAVDEILCKIDNQPHHLFRAPFGLVNADVKQAVHTPIIDWTIDTRDWTGVSEEEIYQSVFEGRFSGGIVLMHDGYQSTVNALKRLLPDLKTDGYQVVSVSALAKAHGCTLYNGKEYIRARKR